jgi:hypothetical protein
MRPRTFFAAGLVAAGVVFIATSEDWGTASRLLAAGLLYSLLVVFDDRRNRRRS